VRKAAGAKRFMLVYVFCRVGISFCKIMRPCRRFLLATRHSKGEGDSCCLRSSQLSCRDKMSTTTVEGTKINVLLFEVLVWLCRHELVRMMTWHLHTLK
jgi:hypothetical protein